MSLDDVVDKAAHLGFDGIELMAKRPHASPIDLGLTRRERLKDRIHSKGLELACIAGYQDFSSGLEYPDMPHFEKELLYLRETVRLAHDLDCRIVRIYSGFLRPNIPFEDQWGWCVTCIREGAKYAEDHGVLLALQNHSEITVHHRDVLNMIEEIGSPVIKVALDAPYIIRTGVALDQAVKDVGSLIVYSTASDHIQRTVSFQLSPSKFRMSGFYTLTRSITVPVGEGEVDYPTFFKALREVGYDTYMAYEICSPIQGGGAEANLDRAAKQSLDYLRKLYKDVYGQRDASENPRGI